MQKNSELRLTRKYYASLTLVMLLLLALFQVSASGSSYFGKEKNNEGAGRDRLKSERTDDIADGTGSSDEGMLGADQKYTVFVEGQEGGAPAAKEALRSLKKAYTAVGTLADALRVEGVESILVCRSDLAYPKDYELLKQALEEGIPVLFAALPDTEFLEQKECQELLGITKILSLAAKTDGLRVLESFMLGGRADYKEFPLENIPYIQVSAQSKVYMCGLYEDQKERGIKNEELPVVAWRLYYDDTPLFLFAERFLDKVEYAGMFISALACMQDSFLYPVINARALLVDQFPFLSYENDEQMQQLYSKNSKRMLEDTMLPGLVAIAKKTGDRISSFATVGIRTGEAEYSDTFSMFVDDMASKNHSIGLGGGEEGNAVRSNFKYYREWYPEYKFLFADGRELSDEDCLSLQAAMPEIGTVVREWDGGTSGGIRYLGRDLIQTVITSRGYAYSDQENLKLKCAITGFGLSNHLVNLADTVYPSRDEDDWKEQNIELGKNLDSYFKPYAAFDTMTIPKEGDRIRRYLNMRYEVAREDGRIIIATGGQGGAAYFVLRTYREIESMDGGTWEKIDARNYLLTLTDETAVLRLKGRSEAYQGLWQPQ